MAIYRPVALFTDLDALRGIGPQYYQTWRIVPAKFTVHGIPLSVDICPRKRTEKGYPALRTGHGYPLQKTQKGGYLAAFLCVASVSVKRSRLLLLSLSFGSAWASP